MTITLSDSGVQFVDNSIQASASPPQIQPVSASVAANALTITLGPCALAFRSTTLGSGTSTVVQNSGTLSLTISSGSTLGTVNNIAARIVVLAINNAGTVELAAVNIAGGNQLDETNLISTTAEGGAGAADSADVIYSTTARTNVAYRVVGFVDITQATAGTWASAPTVVQGAGGQALAAMSSLGYGQTWQDVTGSRVLGTTYYNTTGKPIVIHVDASITSSASSAALTPVINGVTFSVLVISESNGTSFSSTRAPVHFEIPPQVSYRVTGTNATLAAWKELR